MPRSPQAITLTLSPVIDSFRRGRANISSRGRTRYLNLIAALDQAQFDPNAHTREAMAEALGFLVSERQRAYEASKVFDRQSRAFIGHQLLFDQAPPPVSSLMVRWKNQKTPKSHIPKV